MYAHRVISAASMFGASNLTITTSHPMAIVAFTSCGAIFFNGLGAMVQYWVIIFWSQQVRLLDGPLIFL